jgi:stearoyl-CoA desaturase (delta-9 desaturase)
MLGLAHVTRIAPALTFDTSKSACDVATLQAIVTHRYEVLAQYARALRATCTIEARYLKSRAVNVNAAALKRWLQVDTSALPQNEHAQRVQVIAESKVLATVYTMRDELAALWQRSAASTEQLVRELEDWCRRAEASGIGALGGFSRRLRSYRSNTFTV